VNRLSANGLSVNLLVGESSVGQSSVGQSSVGQSSVGESSVGELRWYHFYGREAVCVYVGKWLSSYQMKATHVYYEIPDIFAKKYPNSHKSPKMYHNP
jgi:hypothetical protein